MKRSHEDILAKSSVATNVMFIVVTRKESFCRYFLGTICLFGIIEFHFKTIKTDPEGFQKLREKELNLLES